MFNLQDRRIALLEELATYSRSIRDVANRLKSMLSMVLDRRSDAIRNVDVAGEMPDVYLQDMRSLVRFEHKYSARMDEILCYTMSSKGGRMLFVPGIGGKEADIFAEEMSHVYHQLVQRFFSKASVIERVGKLWQVDLNHAATNFFKYESGIHRVQRVPVTSAQKKIHTSTIGVMVRRNFVVSSDVPESDLRFEVMRSSGPGGQNVNKVNSAVRVIHTPSGLSVKSDESREQNQNRETAIRILLDKINDRVMEIIRSHTFKGRLKAERSDKIRTYNFNANRITDHRFGCSVSNLKEVLSDVVKMHRFIEEVNASS